MAAALHFDEIGDLDGCGNLGKIEAAADRAHFTGHALLLKTYVRGLPWVAAGAGCIRSRSKLEGRIAALRICFRLRLFRLPTLDAVWPVRLLLVSSQCASPAKIFNFRRVAGTAIK